MTFFMIAYAVYKTISPGVVVFPIVFFLTFVAATGQQPFVFTSAVPQKGWLIAHIALIFTGYSALVLSFGASLLYLLQERRLKAKKPSSLFGYLPALEVIDQIGYRSPLFSPRSPSWPRSSPGRPIISALCTGLPPHEIPAYRRESQQCPGRDARAPGHS
jgi:hypothetical protein